MHDTSAIIRSQQALRARRTELPSGVPCRPDARREVEAHLTAGQPRCFDRDAQALDELRALRFVGDPLAGARHVEHVGDLLAFGRDLRERDVEAEVGERLRDRVQHADAVERGHLDDRRRGRVVVDADLGHHAGRHALRHRRSRPALRDQRRDRGGIRRAPRAARADRRGGASQRAIVVGDRRALEVAHVEHVDDEPALAGEVDVTEHGAEHVDASRGQRARDRGEHAGRVGRDDRELAVALHREAVDLERDRRLLVLRAVATSLT